MGLLEFISILAIFDKIFDAILVKELATLLYQMVNRSKVLAFKAPDDIIRNLINIALQMIHHIIVCILRAILPPKPHLETLLVKHNQPSKVVRFLRIAQHDLDVVIAQSIVGHLQGRRITPASFGEGPFDKVA